MLANKFFMDEVVIVADPQGKGYEFSTGIYDYLNTKKERDFRVKMVDISVTYFKDGEFKVRISENIRRKNCFYICDSNKSPCEWFTQTMFTLEAIKSSSPLEINVIFPYMRFSRQDRKDESRVSVGAKALADFVSRYATRCMTVDLHNPQMQEFFSVPVDNLYSFPTLIAYLTKNHSDFLNDLIIVSPDVGGGRRAEALAKRFAKKGIKAEIALGYKTREKEDEVARTMIIGDVNKKNCLVLDDIIDTGNTMIKTADLLREKGAAKIFGYGTHGLFTEGLKKFNNFDKIIVSDTLKNPLSDNLEIVSLVDLFGDAVYRTVIGESLSILFDN